MSIGLRGFVINQKIYFYKFIFNGLICNFCRNNPGCATPLMIASRRGHSRIVELLLQHPDCDPNLLDRDGNNASR